MTKLNRDKIHNLETTLAQIESLGGTIYIPGTRNLPASHWLATLKAHRRGRIHATVLGKECRYRMVEKIHESGIIGKKPRVETRRSKILTSYSVNIKTLGDQEKFLGKLVAIFAE